MQDEFSQLPGNVPKEHEFDIMDNEVFNGLAATMGFVGIVSIVLGVLQGIAGFLTGGIEGFLTIGYGLILTAIGGWVFAASRSFKDVVRTEGSDITLLMIALKQLRKAYLAQAVLYALGIFIIVAGILVVLSANPVH